MTTEAAPATPAKPTLVSFTAAEFHAILQHIKDDSEAIAQKFGSTEIVQKIEHAIAAIDTPQGVAVLSVLAGLVVKAIEAPEDLKSLTFVAGLVEQLIAAVAHPAPLPA